jgi:predicted transcriptional regulator
MSITKNTVRVSLEMSEELNQKLEEMADLTHNSKSELLRKAIALMELAIDAKRAGKKFGIAEKDQILSTEIVGIGI